MDDAVLECFIVWKQRICVGRKEWDKAEKEYHRVCCESRALRGRKIKILISDVKRREREFLKIDLNTLLTQELWSSTATMIVRATNDGFISSINKWQAMLHDLNNNDTDNNNNLSINDDEILQTELTIDQWEKIIQEIDTEAENIAEEVKARLKNDKVKVRKLDRLQDTRKHFERKEKENRSNKRRKLSQPIDFASSISSRGRSSNNTSANDNRRRHRPHRRNRKEVGAIHARNECLAAMELHEAMRTVLSTLKIQQSNLLVCRAAQQALGSCCEKLHSQQRRQLRLIVGGRNNNDDNDDNINENNDNDNDNDDINDDNNRNNMDLNEDNNGANITININNDVEEQQQNIDKEWNRKVEAAKVDSLYHWYRNNVGLL
mmetsp:Transcript_20238/g.20620  ORF Transcript_20238/g.20620 Transcript_20238/m.20620 type:complete len:377 (+) Transcript_20238:2-1132(+)